MRLSDENLRGLTVISADGTAIGSVAELFVSSSDWRVESIRVELRKDVARSRTSGTLSTTWNAGLSGGG